MKLIKKLTALLIPIIVFSCSQATTKIEFTTTASDWYYLGTPGTDGYRIAYDYPTTAITSDIAENGMVLGYLKAVGTNSEWITLPYQYFPGTYTENVNYSHDEGHIYIIVKRSDLGAPSWWSGPFKFIIVPPQRMQELDGIDLNNCHEVEAALK
jgi:hypothetical protein